MFFSSCAFEASHKKRPSCLLASVITFSHNSELSNRQHRSDTLGSSTFAELAPFEFPIHISLRMATQLNGKHQLVHPRFEVLDRTELPMCMHVSHVSDRLMCLRLDMENCSISEFQHRTDMAAVNLCAGAMQSSSLKSGKKRIAQPTF